MIIAVASVVGGVIVTDATIQTIQDISGHQAGTTTDMTIARYHKIRGDYIEIKRY